MNPKYPDNLDPKLREAYDRVMGTGVAQPTAHPQPPHPEPSQPPKMVTEPVKHEEKDSDSGVVHFSADTHKHKKEEKPEPKETTHVEAKSEGKSPVTPILLGIIGALFFIGYALFWAQLFGFNILPSF